MKKLFITAWALCASLPLPAFAAGTDDPLVAMVKAEQFEWRDADESTFAWDVQAYAGYDQNKLWLKTEGETNSEETEEFELQLLWNRAVSAYWDMQLGWRGDFQPESNRSWLAAGVQGLAPGFIETEATFFTSFTGRSAARLRGIYDLRLARQVVLEPRGELNWFSSDDERNGIASGLANLKLGLRFRYEIRPDIAPYVGLQWDKLLGDTADLARAGGEDTSDLVLVAGLRFWF